MNLPKVFISYSWSSATHKEHIREIVERLAADSVECVVDFYDLKEGDDKNHYMERMVQDKDVTHVLVICDKEYSEKANNRKAGVGVESMIISQAIYSSVSQSKFIPLIFEYDENGNPYTPVFLNSRIYIDFSTPEKENDNWERLIRVLYGKPEFTKPRLGKPPAYLSQDAATPTYELNAKFQTLKFAVINERKNINECRRQFLETCHTHADALKVRTGPKTNDFADEVIQIHKDLIPVRDVITEWILLEGNSGGNDFEKSLLLFMEMLLDIRNKPKDVNSWSEDWYLPHEIFSYEVFLYILAALIKVDAFDKIHTLLFNSYLLPSHVGNRGSEFTNYGEFFVSSNLLQNKLAPEGQRLKSPVIELIKINATRDDISFDDLKQADLVALMVSFIKLDIYWYPELQIYTGYNTKYPLFTRAIQHRGFESIALITGIKDSKELIQKLKEGDSTKEIKNTSHFRFGNSFLEQMNIDRLDSLN